MHVSSMNRSRLDVATPIGQNLRGLGFALALAGLQLVHASATPEEWVVIGIALAFVGAGPWLLPTHPLACRITTITTTLVIVVAELAFHRTAVLWPWVLLVLGATPDRAPWVERVMLGGLALIPLAVIPTSPWALLVSFTVVLLLVASSLLARRAIPELSLAMVAHDLRSPLAAIVTQTRLLQLDKLEDEQANRVTSIQVLAEDLIELCHGMVAMFHSQRLHPTPTNLRTELNTILRPHWVHAKSKSMTIRVDWDPLLDPWFEVDVTSFRQIVHNLVGNAVKCSNKEVVLLVRHGVGPDEVELIVEDRGPGFTHAQLRDVTSKLVKNTFSPGLGLEIVRTLVSALNGSIAIQSRLGVGTRVHVRLPLQATEAPDGQEAGPGSEDVMRTVATEEVGALPTDSEPSPAATSAVPLRSNPPPADEAAPGTTVTEEKPEPSTRPVYTIVGAFEHRATFPSPPPTEPSSHEDDTIEPQAIEVRSDLGASEDDTIVIQTVTPTSEVATFPVKIVKDPPPGPTHVLVVDDEPINRRVLIAMLKKLGISSDAAENGQQALDMIADTQYSMVFMDCEMPVKDGFTATEEVRQHRNPTIANLPIVAVTAHNTDEFRQRCRDVGMNEFISKPVKQDSIKSAIALHLESEADTVVLG